MQLTAVFLPVSEGHIGFVEKLPGTNTQGATFEKACENLKEVIPVVLKANREISNKSIAGKEVSREPFDLSAS